MEVLNNHKSTNISESCRSVEDFFSESMGCHENHCHHHHHHEHHENHVHEITEESVEVPNDKKGFVCEFDGCNKVFPSKWKLYQHHRVHTGERPFVCEICNKAFKIKDALNRHRHTHSKDKPYKCTFPGCKKSFSTSHNLKYHLATHSDKKPFVCDYPGCGKSFHTKSQLNQHMRTKTVHQKIDLERRQCAAPLISMESAHNINSGKSVVSAMMKKGRGSTMTPSSSSVSSPRRAIKDITQEVTKSSQASIVKHISKETQRQAQKIRELEGYIKMMQQALSVNNISFPSTTSSSPSVTSGDDGIAANEAKFSMVENMSTDNSDHEAAALSTPSTSTDRDDCYSVNFDDGPELFSLGADHSCSSSSSCCDHSSLFDSITPLEVNDNAAQFDSAFDFMPEEESFQAS